MLLVLAAFCGIFHDYSGAHLTVGHVEDTESHFTGESDRCLSSQIDLETTVSSLERQEDSTTTCVSPPWLPLLQEWLKAVVACLGTKRRIRWGKLLFLLR